MSQDPFTVAAVGAAAVLPWLLTGVWAGVLAERANSRMVSGEVLGNEFAGPLIGGALFGLGAVLPFALNSGVLAAGPGPSPGQWRRTPARPALCRNAGPDPRT